MTAYRFHQRALDRERLRLTLDVAADGARLTDDAGRVFAVFPTHEGRTVAQAQAQAELVLDLWHNASCLTAAFLREASAPQAVA